MRRCRGFTLIEAITVSVVGVIVMIAMISGFIMIQYILQVTNISTLLQSDARAAVRHMTADLRQSTMGYVNIAQNTPAVGTDRIQYSLPLDDVNPDWVDAPVVTIQLDPATNRLLRTEGANTKILANNVNAVNFVDHGINAALYLNELQVSLELERSDVRGKVRSINSTSVIYVRN